jgi:hypothetical protein
MSEQNYCSVQLDCCTGLYVHCEEPSRHSPASICAGLHASQHTLRYECNVFGVTCKCSTGSGDNIAIIVLIWYRFVENAMGHRSFHNFHLLRISVVVPLAFGKSADHFLSPAVHMRTHEVSSYCTDTTLSSPTPDPIHGQTCPVGGQEVSILSRPCAVVYVE